ncbi:MAG: transposase [Bryobacteraceae bacterium]
MSRASRTSTQQVGPGEIDDLVAAAVKNGFDHEEAEALDLIDANGRRHGKFLAADDGFNYIGAHKEFDITIKKRDSAVDEVRRAEFFRKGRKMRDLIKAKKWLLLSRWKNLAKNQRGVLNRVFHLDRRVFKAYLLKESLEGLWDYRYEGAMLNYLRKWIDQLRWQRLPSFQKLADMLLKHLAGLLNYCRTKVRFGVVEAIKGNIRMLINRGRGYQNMRYLLLKAKRMAATNTEYVAFQKTRKAA